MKTTFKLLLLPALLLAACNQQSEIDIKKEELKGYKSELYELKKKITELEKEITELDPSFGKNDNNTVLITTIQLKNDLFEHKIEVRGTVESRKNVMVGAKMGGTIQSIKVKEGQRVGVGQVLATIDADVLRNNIKELETSLELAKTVYERQSNLWKKNIGTEIQYLEAKNRKESLERSLVTMRSQLDQAIVRAPFAGTVDEIPAKVGELTQPGQPMFRLVNPNDVYIKADVSERYLGNFKQGDAVDLYFPSQNKQLKSVVTSVGHVLNKANRTFELEAKVPKVDFSLSPNQVVILNLKDYENSNAIKLPTQLIQRDNKGSFVYKIQKEGESQKAAKVHINIGKSYDGETEVLEGLQINEVIADKGFRELSEGTEVKVKKDI